MSTTHEQQHQIETEADREGVATGDEIAILEDLVEYDSRICNNCFALREEKHRHFRSSGGTATGRRTRDDQTADVFCEECHAGTGKPSLHRPHAGEWDSEAEEWTTESGRPAVDYSNVHCQLDERFLSDMSGTVERDWGKGAPLPKNGEQVSLFRNLSRLRDRLEEKGYDVDWEAWKNSAEELKAEYPTLDRDIFGRLVADLVGDDQDCDDQVAA